MIKKFHHMKAHEHIINNNIVFVSYDTPQAVKTNGNIYQCTEKYSSTTTNQVNRWIRETAHGKLFKVSAKDFNIILIYVGYKGALGYLNRFSWLG